MTLIDEARDGRGNGVIVAGAEGMGKSRIVRDVTFRAQLDGARVFCGRCPVNRKTIYAPFFDIFQQLVTAVNPEADVGRGDPPHAAAGRGPAGPETQPAAARPEVPALQPHRAVDAGHLRIPQRRRTRPAARR